jgi:hypothetical protein
VTEAALLVPGQRIHVPLGSCLIPLRIRAACTQVSTYALVMLLQDAMSGVALAEAILVRLPPLREVDSPHQRTIDGIGKGQMSFEERQGQ